MLLAAMSGLVYETEKGEVEERGSSGEVGCGCCLVIGGWSWLSGDLWVAFGVWAGPGGKGEVAVGWVVAVGIC